jgi:hypothetical protein
MGRYGKGDEIKKRDERHGVGGIGARCMGEGKEWVGKKDESYAQPCKKGA